MSAQALVQLTTVKPSTERVIREDGGDIRVKLAPGEVRPAAIVDIQGLILNSELWL